MQQLKPDSTRNKGKPLPAPLRRKLEAFVDERGDVEAAKELGISRQTMFRAMAGRPVHRGTASVVETAFGPGGSR